MESKKSQCEAAAKMYYEGVRLFASSHFDKTDHDYCASDCAFKNGSPAFNIPQWMILANIYLFKVNNRNTRKRYKSQQQRHQNDAHNVVMMSLLLT